MSSNINANGIQVGSNYRTGAVKTALFKFNPSSVSWNTALSVSGQKYYNTSVSAIASDVTDIQTILNASIIDFSGVSPNDFCIGFNGANLHMAVKSSAMSAWNTQGWLQFAINYIPTES